jgi:Ca-activated chloride channel homolog
MSPGVLESILTGVEFSRPGWLLMLWLLVPVGWYAARSLSDLPRWQRRLSCFMRGLMILLLALALAGLTRVHTTRKMFTVLALDRSESLDEASDAAIQDFVRQLQQVAGENELGWIDFAATPRELLHPLPSDPLPSDPLGSSAQSTRPTTVELEPGWRRGTDIAAALDWAAAAIPAGYVPQIVLLSDGRQTTGDALQTAAGLGVPVSTLPLPVRREEEVQVVAVEAPLQVRQGEPFMLDITLASNHDDEGYIDIYRGDVLESAGGQPVRIVAGENRFRYRQVIEDERQVEYAVRIRGFRDALVDNNAAGAVVFAAGPPSVLLVDSDVNQAQELRWALEEQSLTVAVRPPQGVPLSLSELQRFDCLVLSNVPASALNLQQMEVIRSYVQELAGGLVVIGGDQAFSLGGYDRTVLEELLPVSGDFEKEQEKPSLAMVLVMDKSGSMSGEKLEMAKEAARGAVELLGPKDQLGIIGFDGAPYWISELGSVADKVAIVEPLSRMEAAGGTNIYPALSDAYDALAGTAAKLKHVILLTDGHSQPGNFPGVIEDMLAARITLSSVAVGQEADQTLLEELARSGGGRYYFCESPKSIPQIFARETLAASKSSMNEEPFLPQLVRPTRVLAGIDLDAAPLLLGYVETQAKPTSELILASESGAPLLVWWRYGLGMTVAFTSDAKSQWGAEWLAWPEFGPFWAQVIRHTIRSGDAEGMEVTVHPHAGGATLTLDAIGAGGEFLNAQPTQLTVVGPDLQRQQQTLTQTAPGRYEGAFQTSQPGGYALQLDQVRPGAANAQQTRGVVVGYPEELRLGPIDEPLLRQIADVSGGQFAPAPDEVFEPGRRRARVASPQWPWLLRLALLCMLADIALRRIAFPKLPIALRRFYDAP